MNKEIIEKIQKLLSLATSDNQHEAELASKKAQELLIKYNLSLSQIEVPEYETTSIGVMRNPAMIFINNILTDYFFVNSFRKHNNYVYYGTKENLLIAEYIRDFLNKSFKTLYKNEAKRNQWKSGANRKAFYFGLYKGLKTQLEENKIKVDTGNGLIVINAKLSNYVKAKHPNVRSRNQTVNIKDQNALEFGFEQGKNLRINRGIEQKNENNTKVFLK